MKSLVTALILFMAVSVCLGDDKAVEAIQQFAEEQKVSAEELKKGLGGLIWKRDKSAVAACFQSSESTLCLVAYQTSDGFKISDVSRVEGMNFGKFGFRRSHYDRFLTEPIEWNETGRFIYTNFNGRARHQIRFQTRAWRGGQRYTISEPLILDADWKPLWR